MVGHFLARLHVVLQALEQALHSLAKLAVEGQPVHQGSQAPRRYAGSRRYLLGWGAWLLVGRWVRPA